LYRARRQGTRAGESIMADLEQRRLELVAAAAQDPRVNQGIQAFSQALERLPAPPQPTVTPVHFSTGTNT